MATKNEILLEINVSSADALKNVERAKLAIAGLRQQQNELRKSYERGEKSEEDYVSEMAELNRQMIVQQSVVKDNIKAHRDAVKANEQEEGSLQALRGQLSQLIAAYDSLSQAEREGAKGADLLAAINETTAALNTAEQASGRFQRNVGNYQSIWDAPISKIGAFGDKLKSIFDFDTQMQKLQDLGGAFAKVAEALNGASRKTIGFTAATKQASDTGSQARGGLNATAEATTNVGDAATSATRSQIGFKTVSQQAASASQQQAAASTAATTATAGLGGAARTAAGGFTTLLKAAMKFMLSPIGAIIAAVGAAVVVVVKAVQQLTAAFRKNDDAMTALSSVMGVFKAIGSAVGAVFEAIVKAVTPLIEGVGKLGRAFVSILPGMRDVVKAQEDLVRAADALEDTHRRNVVERAKADKRIAELNNQVADSETYTLAERRKALDESIELERQATTAEAAEVRERLRLKKLQAKQDHDTSDEAKNEIAELEAEVLRVEAAGEAANRRAISRRAAFNKEIADQRREAAKKAEEEAKERAEKEAAAVQSLRDLIINQMQDGEAKEVETLKNSTAKQVEELKRRLSTEKNLTEEARRAISEQIVLIEAHTAVEVQSIHDRYNEEEVAKSLKVTTEIWQARLAAARKGSEEEREVRRGQLQEQARQEQAALIKRLTDNEITEQQYEELAALNRAKNRQALAAIDEEARKAEEANVRQHWDNLINSEIEGSIAQMDAKISAKRAEIDALQQLDNESDEAYKGRQIALNSELLQLTEQRATAEVEIERAKAEALGGLFGNISGMLEAAAGDNVAMVKAAKVAALAQVAIEQGIAISKAVSSAAAGDPYTYAIRVASAIASTIAAMASAISSINDAGAQGFARGGLVQGPGTATSDSVPARLSAGEFVVNAESTRRHLADLVAINGGWGATAAPAARYAAGGVVGVEALNASTNIQAMQIAMKEAVSEIQPVVSVREITSVAKKIQAKENITNRL